MGWAGARRIRAAPQVHPEHPWIDLRRSPPPARPCHYSATVEEIETKLDVHPGFALPDLADLVADGGEAAVVGPQDLRATYFDTEDLRLVRAGVTLRHRIEDGVGRWQLKLPLPTRCEGATRRLELHHDGAATRPPALLRAQLTAYTRGAALVRVARLRTARTTVVLRHPDGAAAEVCDDEVSVYDGNRLVARFRELEVESADDALRGALVARLRDAGAEPTDQQPKLVRALGPLATHPADVTVPPLGEPDPERPLGQVVARALLVDLDRMVRHEPGTRRGEDVEELHQMRVATRRLRTTLKTYRPVLDAGWADALRERLRSTAAALGEVRDLDVLLDRLDTEDLDGAAAEGRDQLAAVLRSRREITRGRLLGVLDHPDHAALLKELVRAAHAPRCLDPGGPAGPQLAPLAAKAWTRLRKAERAMAPHDVRIRIKRLRYAAEAIEPAFGKPARKLAKAAGAAQEVLGGYQDAWVARDAYLGLLAQEPLSREGVFALGILVARAEAAMAASLAAWPDAWSSLRKPGRRRFLKG